MTIKVSKVLAEYLVPLISANKIWVAFSGGKDSSVLLHALFWHAKIDNNKIHAVHIHHGLSKNADLWAKHCQQQANNYGLSFTLHKLDQKPKKAQSIEAWARDARYEYLAKLVAQNELLLVAHHQQDQAETLLLQLFRGAGPKGLSSMPVTKAFGQGQLLRPFINLSQNAITNYISQHRLAIITDESNHHYRFDRNFIRDQVLPLLQDRMPSVIKCLARSASHAQDQEALVELLMAEKLSMMVNKEHKTLDLTHFNGLDPLLKQRVLRDFLAICLPNYPSTVQLEAILNDVILARHDRCPCFKLGAFELRRFNHKLYVLPHIKKTLLELPIAWSGANPLMIPGWPTPIHKQDLEACGLDVASLNWQNISIRFRQGGERCKIKGHRHSKSLKKHLQTGRIPPWSRECTPLLYEGETLKMVIGLGVCETVE